MTDHDGRSLPANSRSPRGRSVAPTAVNRRVTAVRISAEASCRTATIWMRKVASLTHTASRPAADNHASTAWRE